jgi:hypothetical protein
MHQLQPCFDHSKLGTENEMWCVCTRQGNNTYMPKNVTFMYLFYIPVKKKLSHYTPWRHMGGEEVWLLLILNLSTRWGWVVSVTPQSRFTPGERTPGTHWIEGWVGPRTGLDAGARRKILCPCRGSNLDRPIIQPVVRRYTAWATAAHIPVNKTNCGFYFLFLFGS